MASYLGQARESRRLPRWILAFPMYESAGVEENWQNLQLLCGMAQVTLAWVLFRVRPNRKKAVKHELT